MKNFKVFLSTFIRSLRLQAPVTDYLTSDKAIAIYRIAFTHSLPTALGDASKELDINILFPKSKIYESYEQIGDALIKSFMANYFYRRFPKLWNNNSGVKIVARLMIKYGSKEVLADIAEQNGFWPYIQICSDISSKQRRMSILEDVFEAFIGATSVIVDCETRIGCGYVVVYTILEHLFNQMDIPLDYDNLFDAKTRLKELVDLYKDKLGVIGYECTRAEDEVVVSIVQTLDGKKVCIGVASADVKARAEQHASQQALNYLKLRGFEKQIQKEYNDLIF